MSAPSGSTSRTTVPKMGCGYAVCAMLALAGIGLLWLANVRRDQRRTTDAWVAGSIGAGLCLASVALIAPMQAAVTRAKERRQREESRPTEPWTWEPAWTARGGILESGSPHHRARMWFGVAAIAVALPVMSIVPREFARGNNLALLALIFPLVGCGVLGAAALEWWRRRKFGVARFVPDALPIPLGGGLAGMILVERALVAKNPGRVSLDCWCTRHEEDASRTLHAHTERVIAPTDWTVTTRESRFFVQLPVRGSEVTSMGPAAAGAPACEWRLRVEMPAAGADFVAEFVLPVFRVEGQGVASAGARAPCAGTDDRSEIWRAAGIREEPQPGATGATALVFPRGIGRPLIMGPLLMAVIFGLIAAILAWSPIPTIFAVFLGLFALLPAITLPALWSGGGERVWVEGGAVQVTRGAGIARRIAAADVQAIETNKNVGIGTQQFYRVVARTRTANGRRFAPRVEIASFVRGEEAAQAVVAWLEERLTSARP